MLIDCDSCAVRNLACADCVVTVLLGMPASTSAEPDAAAPGQTPVPGARVELDGPERAAIAVLAGQGLVPPLRLVPRAQPSAQELLEGMEGRAAGEAGDTAHNDRAEAG
jgi:hypothetical protein